MIIAAYALRIDCTAIVTPTFTTRPSVLWLVFWAAAVAATTSAVSKGVGLTGSRVVVAGGSRS